MPEELNITSNINPETRKEAYLNPPFIPQKLI